MFAECDRRFAENRAVLCDCVGVGGAYGNRTRLEQLLAEVGEARQENQWLNKQTIRLRGQLDDVQRVRASAWDPRAWLDKVPSQASRAAPDELLQLKRQLGELQQENAALKRGGAAAGRGGGAAGRGIGAAGDRDSRAVAEGGRVPAEEYQALQRQLDELARARDAAAAQNQELRRRQLVVATPSPPHSGVGLLSQSPQTPARPGDRYASPATLAGTATSAGFGGSAAGAEPADMARRLQALHAENEVLRRKVRMLAVA